MGDAGRLLKLWAHYIVRSSTISNIYYTEAKTMPPTPPTRTAPITREAIHAAADRITSEGGTPTLAALRVALGGGSYTAISHAMQSWKAGVELSTPGELVREPVPSIVSERAETLISEIWWSAMEFATARLSSEHEALTKSRQETEAEYQAAIELADQLSAEIEQIQANIAAFERSSAEYERSARAELEARIQAKQDADKATAALTAKLEAMTERAAVAEARAAQAESNARISEQAIQARLDNATRELEVARAETAEARAAAKKSGEEAAELRGRLSALTETKP